VDGRAFRRERRCARDSALRAPLAAADNTARIRSYRGATARLPLRGTSREGGSRVISFPNGGGGHAAPRGREIPRRELACERHRCPRPVPLHSGLRRLSGQPLGYHRALFTRPLIFTMMSYVRMQDRCVTIVHGAPPALRSAYISRRRDSSWLATARNCRPERIIMVRAARRLERPNDAHNIPSLPPPPLLAPRPPPRALVNNANAATRRSIGFAFLRASHESS